MLNNFFLSCYGEQNNDPKVVCVRFPRSSACVTSHGKKATKIMR
jgi:hypothetical protein